MQKTPEMRTCKNRALTALVSVGIRLPRSEAAVIVWSWEFPEAGRSLGSPVGEGWVR